MGFPPAEERITTLSATGIIDVFGNNFKTQDMIRMATLEEDSIQSAIVILSDIQLDNPYVRYAIYNMRIILYMKLI
jgi:hypothetical protein